MPTLNEAMSIVDTLHSLQYLRDKGHEVIVVDGGSTDNTCHLAIPLVDQFLQTSSGRAQQMNVGAHSAHHEILLFLHADTYLPQDADDLIIKSGHAWGRFDVRLSGKSWHFRVIAFFMNWRSYLTGIATGDQAIFVLHRLYIEVKGFPEIPLMEDIALSHRLKRICRPLCIRVPVMTSSRRWEEKGIKRTILLMWGLRLAYYLGISPHHLKKIY